MSFKDTIGLGMKFIQGQPQTDLEMVTDLRLGWVRDTVRWPDIEPSPGHYAPLPADFEERLRYYRAYGVGIVFILAYGNAAYADKYDPEAFGRFAAHMARVLKDAGVDFILECFNEPHNFGLRQDLGGGWDGGPVVVGGVAQPSPWVVRYCEMVNSAVAKVYDYDPTVRVVTCEDMYLLHYRFLDQGLDTRLWGMALHPYVKGVPELGPIGADTPWMAPYNPAIDEDKYAPSAFQYLYDYARSKGHDPRFLITEVGWPLEPAAGDTDPVTVTEERRAAYLVRSLLTYHASDIVEATLWFSAQDGPDGAMGLQDNSQVRRRDYDAFRTMMRFLGDADFAERTRGRSKVSGLQTLIFARGGSDVLVAWYADGGGGKWGNDPVPGVSAPLTVPRDVSAYDMFGNPLVGNELQVDWQPVYLVGAVGALSGV